MSVYIPKHRDGRPKSQTYHYDFRIKVKGEDKSRRFQGSTGQRTKRAAEAVEDQQRLLAAQGKLTSGMTVREACDRYWTEVCAQAPTAHAQRTARLCLVELVTYFGADTPLLSITPNTVAEAAAARAATPTKRNRKAGQVVELVSTGKLPAPATVNRQVIEPMRRVLRRAKKHWDVPIDLDQFSWGGRDGIKRKEPEGRTRALTMEEETRFWAALDPDYHLIAEMYIITGKRQSLWVMVPKTTVDLSAGIVRMRMLKKRTLEWIAVDLTERELEIVTEAYQQSTTDYLFTAVSKRKRDNGARRPITTRMLNDALKRAFEAAKISDIRPHDFRHTFATRAIAAGASLRDLMTGMDHSSINSTMRYAHVATGTAQKVRSSVSVNKTLPENVVRLQRKGGE